MADVVVTIGGNSKELKKLLRSEIRAMKRLENTKKRQERQGVSRRRRTRREEARERVQTERSVNRRTSRESRRGRGRSNRIGRLDRTVRRGGRAFAGGTGILTSLTSEIKGVLEYSRALSRMAVQAGVSVEKQMEIEEQINRVSITTGKSRDEIVQGMKSIVDKSGDLELAIFLMEKMAKASQGMGAEMKNIGFFASAMKTGLQISNKQVEEFFDILITQGDKGSFTLEDLSRSGEALFGAAAGAGIKTKKGLIDFGALVQIGGGTGTSAEAATAVKNLTNELSGRAKQIKAVSGVNVFIPGTKGKLRNLEEILKEIVIGVGGDVRKLQRGEGRGKTIGFGLRSIKPIRALAVAFRDRKEGETGFELFDKFLNLGESAFKRTEAKFGQVEERSAAIAFDKLAAVFTVAGDKALAPLLTEMAKALTTIIQDEDKLKRFIQQFRDVGNTLVDVFEIMSKAGPFLNTVASFLGIKIDPRAETFNNKGFETNLNVKTDITVDPLTGKTKSEKTTVTRQNNNDLGTTTFSPSAGR